MGYSPEDENFDEFMDASAEEWSKPEAPEPVPASEQEPINRWGSPIPDPNGTASENRMDPEKVEAIAAGPDVPAKKSGSKWWIILIVVLVVLCLCACVAIFGLPLLGLNLFNTDFIQY